MLVFEQTATQSKLNESYYRERERTTQATGQKQQKRSQKHYLFYPPQVPSGDISSVFVFLGLFILQAKSRVRVRAPRATPPPIDASLMRLLAPLEYLQRPSPHEVLPSIS
jgi:hypothetical protein